MIYVWVCQCVCVLTIHVIKSVFFFLSSWKVEHKYVWFRIIRQRYRRYLFFRYFGTKNFTDDILSALKPFILSEVFAILILDLLLLLVVMLLLALLLFLFLTHFVFVSFKRSIYFFDEFAWLLYISFSLPLSLYFSFSVFIFQVS